MSHAGVTEQDVDSFERDGAIGLRGAFALRWIETVARGIEKELAVPGERFTKLTGSSPARRCARPISRYSGRAPPSGAGDRFRGNGGLRISI
jgi:hypothetical protein